MTIFYILIKFEGHEWEYLTLNRKNAKLEVAEGESVMRKTQDRMNEYYYRTMIEYRAKKVLKVSSFETKVTQSPEEYLGTK